MNFRKIVFLIAALCAPHAAHATSWTLLCTSHSRTVHMERFNAEIPPEALEEARIRHSDAICVTLASQDDSIRDESQPPPINGNLQPLPQEGAPPELSVAIRALRGEVLGNSAPRNVKASGAPPLQEAHKNDASDLRPTSAQWARLGIYKSKDSMDALADWQRILLAEPSLAYLTPSVTQTDDGWLMLSAGPLHDDIEKRGLCVAGVKLELDCIYGENSQSEPSIQAKNAAIIMAASWPDQIANWSEGGQCNQVFGLELDGPNYDTDRRAGLSCWRSPFDVPRRYLDLASVDYEHPPTKDEDKTASQSSTTTHVAVKKAARSSKPGTAAHKQPTTPNSDLVGTIY